MAEQLERKDNLLQDTIPFSCLFVLEAVDKISEETRRKGMHGCLHQLQNSTSGQISTQCANIQTEVQSQLQSHFCVSEQCAGWSLQAPTNNYQK